MNSTRPSNRPIAACMVIITVTAAIAVVSDDPLLMLACGSVVAATVGLLWRAGEASALLMAAGMQLSQVLVRPLYATLVGVSLEDVSLHFGDVTSATWFSLAALMSLVVGMYTGQLGAKHNAPILQREAKSWTPGAAFIFCVLTLLLATTVMWVGNLSDGLRQPALAASRIEWVGVFVLVYVCMVHRRGFAYVILVIFLELVKTVGGFFADFKEVFVVVLVAVIAANLRLKPRTIMAAVVLGGILLGLGSLWSAIKGDYREYISYGSQEQTIVVPGEGRLAYLMDRVSATNWETIRHGFELLVRRWGYVDLLGATMHHVPEAIPFEDGALVGATIMHVLQPRLLFPDKPPLPSDTATAVRYSGIPFDSGNNAVGTSISLGYVAELYVDFGRWGSIAAAFILGFLFGYSVKLVTSSTTLPAIVSSGLGIMLMMSIASFEQALPKMMGGFLVTFAFIMALRRSLLPYVLKRIATKTHIQVQHHVA
jgi:hypothetical protein